MSYNGVQAFDPRSVMQLAPLNIADDATMERWLALPADDFRTLNEYAANPAPPDSGGYFDRNRRPVILPDYDTDSTGAR